VAVKEVEIMEKKEVERKVIEKKIKEFIKKIINNPYTKVVKNGIIVDDVIFITQEEWEALEDFAKED
jgi:hypothetical protein